MNQILMIILKKKNLAHIKETLYNIIQMINIKIQIIMLKKEELLSIEEEMKLILLIMSKIKKILIKYIIGQEKIIIHMI